MSSSISARSLGWLSFATMFVVGTDTFLTAPLLPLLQRELSVPAGRGGWLVSAYAVGYAMTALVAGPLSDRQDRRRVLLAGLAAFTLCTAAGAVAWDFSSLLVVRLLAGVAAAFVTPQVWASIPTLVDPPRILATMGRATAGLAVAQLAGIPVGSFLSTFGWRIPFAAVGVAALVLGIVLMVRFPAVPAARDASTRTGYAEVLSSAPLVLSLVAYLAFQCGNFAALSFLASWWARDFAADQPTIGGAMLVVGAGNALGSFTGARVSARLGSRLALPAGIAALTACYSLTVVAHSLVAAVLPVAAAMVVAGMLFPVLMHQLQEQTRAARGTVSSLANAAMYLGTTVAGAVGGPLLARGGGYTGVVLFLVATSATSIGLYAVAGRAASARPRA